MIHTAAVVVLNTKMFLVEVPVLRSGFKLLAKECAVCVGCLHSSRGECEYNSDDCVCNMHHAATLLLLSIALFEEEEEVLLLLCLQVNRFFPKKRDREETMIRW